VIRTLAGAFLGVVLGVAVAVPAFALAAGAERAALRPPPGAGPDPAPVEVAYYTQLLYCAITAGGFGGVIGAIAGGVSAVERAARGPGAVSPD
jgi:hypothetical protein